MAETLKLYRNDGRGGFIDVSAAAGVARVVPSMGANVGDIDNDGFLDVYLGTGAPSFGSLIPNILLRNDAGRRFGDVTEATGTGHLQKGHGVAFADLDDDGDQDIVLNAGGAVPGDRYDDALFENPGTPGQHWLEVRLIGTRSNRAGIGAKIRVVVAASQKDAGQGGRLRYREVSSGGSFGSNSYTQHVGLGRATAVESIEVTWPASETRQVFRNPPIDTLLEIREDAAAPVVRPRTPFRLGRADGNPPADRTATDPAPAASGPSPGRYNHRVIRAVLVVLLAALVAPAAAQGPPQLPPGQGPIIPKAPDADTILAQAVQLHQAGDLVGAITNYEAYLKTEPNNAGVRSNLGAAYVRLGRLADGVTEYRKALAIDPGNPMFRFNLALALYKGGKFPEAVTELQSVLARQADHLQARLLLGDCYLKQGRFQDVVDLLAPWEAVVCRRSRLRVLLGTAFIQTDRLDQGQRVIDTIFKDGESAEGHLLMGTVHMRRRFAGGAGRAAQGRRAQPAAPGGQRHARPRAASQRRARGGAARVPARAGDQPGRLQHQPAGRRAEEARPAVRRRPRLHRARLADAAGRHRRPLRAGRCRGLDRRNEPARQLLEGVVAAAPKYSEACALLATVYYRLQRKADGDRMRARVEELNAEVQGRQPGAKPPQYSGRRQPPATCARFARRRSTTRAPCRRRTSRSDVRLAVAVQSPRSSDACEACRPRACVVRTARRRLLEPDQ